LLYSFPCAKGKLPPERSQTAAAHPRLLVRFVPSDTGKANSRVHSTPRTTTVIYKADTEIRLTITHSPYATGAVFASEPTLPVPCGCAGAYRPGKKKTARLRYSPNGHTSKLVTCTVRVCTRSVAELHGSSIPRLCIVCQCFIRIILEFSFCSCRVHAGFTQIGYNGIVGVYARKVHFTGTERCPCWKCGKPFSVFHIFNVGNAHSAGHIGSRSVRARRERCAVGRRYAARAQRQAGHARSGDRRQKKPLAEEARQPSRGWEATGATNGSDHSGVGIQTIKPDSGGTNTCTNCPACFFGVPPHPARNRLNHIGHDVACGVSAACPSDHTTVQFSGAYSGRVGNSARRSVCSAVTISSRRS